MELNDTMPQTNIRGNPNNKNGTSKDFREPIKPEWEDKQKKQGDDFSDRRNDYKESYKHAGRKRKKKVLQEDEKNTGDYVPRRSPNSLMMYSHLKKKSVRRALNYDDCDEVIGNCMET